MLGPPPPCKQRQHQRRRLCGSPIEDHASGTGTHWAYLPEGSAVGIPLRTLIVRDAENLLVAGRCFSATHDAHASVRSMAQCMAMGQAAGTTAALAARGGGGVRAVPAQRVRDALRSAGAILEIAPASKAESGAVDVTAARS